MRFPEPRLVLLSSLWLGLMPGMAAAMPGEFHWAFEPCTKVVPPETRDASWPRHPVDRFILARLEAEGWKPSPEADRVTWLRRVTLDLTGLPPTPEQVRAFVEDSSGGAWEQVVDDLLASPRYGERWAQHWLDVVRYADTHGFEVNTERPNAWPYRDYVIRAFNLDTPYDRFIREQIAGDAFGVDEATGFLVTASVLLPGQIGADEPSKRLARQDALDEIVVNIGQTFLGLSVGCARCHEHKFDPISQRDYYAMQAFVAGVEYEERDWRTPEFNARRQRMEPLERRIADINRDLTQIVASRPAPCAPRRATDPRLNEETFAPRTARYVRFTIHDTRPHPTLGLIEPCVDEFEILTDEPTPRNVALASLGTKVSASGSRTSDSHRLEHIHDGHYGNERSWMSDEPGRGWVLFELPEPVRIGRIRWGRDRDGRFNDRLATAYTLEAGLALEEMRWLVFLPPPGVPDGLEGEQAQQALRLWEERKGLEAKIRAMAAGPKVFAGLLREPDEIHLLTRGDPEQPGEVMAPAVLAVLGGPSLPVETPDPERRRALADWLASPQHPLTARVMVNRIWQGHFGRGLVETSSDFGRLGSKPSHPELLDWLAAEFIRSGWSIKHMHRLLVLSATYRQADVPQAAAQTKDAENRLLWRYPARRLEAEAIRDAMLSVSGELNGSMFGPGFDLFDKRGGLSGFKPVEAFEGEGLRRLIYAHKVRREREAVFGAFDCPDAGQSTARRRESTTPIQALNLFNSRFTVDRAEAFARRVQSRAGPDVGSQIDEAWRLALNRAPFAAEREDAEPVVRTHGLATLCRVLFNSNEFLQLP